jgi:chemotaxis protein methyltransferase CheR
MSSVPATARLPDRVLRHAGELLGARCGLRFHSGNRELLEEGLSRAARAEGCQPGELLDRLEAAPPEDDSLLQAVIRHVTVGETYFFRHPEHFQLLEQHLVPALRRARHKARELRAWSAGCASGEEAWSLAMALSVAAGPDFPVSVLGTDINKAALQTARAGEYGRWSVRSSMSAPPGQLHPGPDGGVTVARSLRRRVRFTYLNLRDPIYPSLLTATQGLDLIFCRNVLVYFFPEAARAVLERMRDCLADGGWLVVSGLDLSLAPPGLEVVTFGATAVLRRRVEERVEPVRPAAPRPRVITPTATLRAEPPSPHYSEAKRAADEGDLERAVELARRAVNDERSPRTLHLLGLVLSERGETAETLQLLRETVARAPDYVLGHLGLGLHEAETPPTRLEHLRRVTTLLAQRRDEELLAGPDPLPVAWVRKMAAAAIKQVEDAR